MSTSTIVSASIQPGDAAQSTLTSTAGIPGETIVLTGAQTYNIDLAMLPADGAQAWMVRVEAKDADGETATAPVRVNFTPGGYRFIPPGGWIQEAAPRTDVGVTSLQLVSTANAVVHVTAVG